MDHYVTGTIIKELRSKKKMTQQQLADMLKVSDKTVSKWETGRGLPDISLIEPLATALGISVAELLSGATSCNRNTGGNLLKSKFYSCPICGNVLWSAGEGAYSCCGILLPPLDAEQADSEHRTNVELIDNELYITVGHAMEKEHYIRFMAYVTGDTVQVLRLYPEQPPEGRFMRRGRGMLYVFCNRHGFYKIRI